jgi:biotin transporter BioY
MKKTDAQRHDSRGDFRRADGILTQIQFQVPLSRCPSTWRCFGIHAGALLGPRYGTLSMAVYVLLGAVGLRCFPILPAACTS